MMRTNKPATQVNVFPTAQNQERGIREIVLAIEEKITAIQQTPVQQREPRETRRKNKKFPNKPSQKQWDAVEVVLTEFRSKKVNYTIQDLIDACNKVEPGVFYRSGATAQMIRAMVCAISGMIIRWAQEENNDKPNLLDAE